MRHDLLMPYPMENMSAYDFLSDYLPNKVFRPVPLRLDMRHWIRREGELGPDSGERFPECGTIGCIGGWTTLLLGPASLSRSLGINSAQEQELCLPTGWQEDAGIGTQEYVENVIAHLQRFCQKYEAQLRAHWVYPEDRHLS